MRAGQNLKKGGFSMKKISTGKMILIVVAVLAVVVGMSLFGAYNGLATLRETVDTQQSTIQTQLQRRSDLIPNLTSTVIRSI